MTDRNLADSFICVGCQHELPIEFNLRTEGYCYLCDPEISIEELLSDVLIDELFHFPEADNEPPIGLS